MTLVSIVHDYLTQKGGAERVALQMVAAFPGAQLYTSLFDPEATFPEFGSVDTVTSPLNRVAALRRSHRAAFPFLPLAFSRMEVPGDVVVCSSSGWAHGASVEGRKVVYCHSPAKWLYQPDRYFSGSLRSVRPAVRVVRSPLRSWDQAAARSADRYLVNSEAVKEWVQDIYRIEAVVVPPAYSVEPEAPRRPVDVEPGFLLCVSRLLPYKNVGPLVEAMADFPSERLVIVGRGPDEGSLRAAGGPNVTFLGGMQDDQLRWLYQNCVGVVCPSYEDFGLVPVEAAAFGQPTAALRWGGFCDTVVEGSTGVFFDAPTPSAIKSALIQLTKTSVDKAAIRKHAEKFSPEAFTSRLQRAVEDLQ
jgi:glycosyltransferase involved in cell wall biosynthesis